MPEKRLRVLLSFTHGSDHDVVDIAGAVIACMKGNPAFPDPNVDLAVVQTILTEFIAAISTASQGGPKDTAAKDKKRLELVGLLRHLAYYVQTTCNDDLAKLLSSGFLSKSTNRASTPLPTPNILNIIQGNTGQLLVTVKAVRNARAYDLRYASLPGGKSTSGSWQTVSGFTSSRSMPINGLTPGTTYTVQARTLGTASRFTDWSDPVSHICI